MEGCFIRQAYGSHKDKREVILAGLIELAGRLGVAVSYDDNRDMFLLADHNGDLVRSYPGFKEAAAVAVSYHGWKYYNRTHPSCPQKLKDQFDQKTGW